jgi:hypothetical protein
MNDRTVEISSKLDCPQCKLDCSGISPENTKVFCPRCGSLVVFYGIGYDRSQDATLPKRKLFSYREANRAVICIVFAAFILFMLGFHKGMFRMLIHIPTMYLVSGFFMGYIENRWSRKSYEHK